MRLSSRFFSVGAVLALAAGQASAQYIRPAPHGPIYQGPNCPQVQPYPSAVPQPQQPGAQPQQPGAQPQQPGAQPQQPGAQPQQPGAQPQQADQQQAPSTDAFSQAPAAGTSGAEGFNPTMFGDIIGPSVRRIVRNAHGSTFSARVPVASRGNFKISESESAKPLDRVYFNYNFFGNANLFASDPTAGTADVHRETIGFEKTLMDGNASFGMRLPIFQTRGDGAVSQDGIGDLTLIFKYALINDSQTGDALSTGLVLTLPTGNDNLPGEGANIHPTVFQPFVACLFNMEDWYVHGFTSLAVPTDDRDATIFFNDFGFGYWLYKTQEDVFLTGIVPTLELHVTTPLNHRGLGASNTSDVGVADTLALTGGLSFVLENNSTLGVAAGTPLTGPKPYDIEVLVQFNWRF